MQGIKTSPAVLLAAIVLLAASCVGGPERAPETKPETTLTPQSKEIRGMESLSALLSAGDYSGAESRLRAMIAEQPAKNEYRILLSSVLVSAGKVQEARAAAADAVSAEPSSPAALMAAAQVERFAGDEKTLRPALDKVLAVDPANAEALAAYGDLWYAGKNYSRAEEFYQEEPGLGAFQPFRPPGPGPDPAPTGENRGGGARPR